MKPIKTISKNIVAVASLSGIALTIIFAQACGQNMNANISLHEAARLGQTETVIALIDEGADILAKDDDGNTPLHLATSSGQTETVIALIDRGANVNTRDKDGNTPLHIATSSGQTETAIALIRQRVPTRQRKRTKTAKRPCI